MLELLTNKIVLWTAFNVFVLALLALDLGVFHRQAHRVTIKEALIWTAVWTALTLAFNVGVYFMRGTTVALQFLTGFLIERALSVDNLFVFLLIFSYFAVDARYQHKVLMWGILGALVMRGAMIVLGVALIREFHWVLYIFGAFLIITGIKMGLQKEGEMHPERNVVVRLAQRIIPVTRRYYKGKFFVRVDRRLMATPLFIVVVAIEVSDLVFALDSIPAIFAVTTDPFIVYTSNVFAILGLRALYFALAGMMNLFAHLKYGLAFILSFVGVKMVLAEIFPIPIGVALGVVAGVIAISILTSVIWPPKPARSSAERPPEADTPPEPLGTS